MKWDDRCEKFGKFVQKHKPKLNKTKLKNLDEILNTGSELGFFDGLTIQPGLALEIISIWEYVKKNKKIDESLVL